MKAVAVWFRYLLEELYKMTENHGPDKQDSK